MAVVAITVLVIFVIKIDWASFIETFLQVPIWVWILSVFGLSGSHWLRAGRLKAEWSSKLKISWPQAWGIMVKHSAWVVLTPFRAGEAIYVWVFHSQAGVSVKEASISLVKLRIQDAWVVGVLSLCLFAPIPTWSQIASAALLIFVSIWMMRHFWPLVRHKLFRQDILDDASPIAPPQNITWFFATSNWVLKGCAVALPLYALLPVGFMAALQGAMAGELSAILPLQPPAGAGLYEAGVLFGLQLYETVAWTEAIAAALVVHVLLLLVTIVSAALAKILGWSESTLLPVDSVSVGSSTQTF